MSLKRNFFQKEMSSNDGSTLFHICFLPQRNHMCIEILPVREVSRQDLPAHFLSLKPFNLQLRPHDLGSETARDRPSMYDIVRRGINIEEIEVACKLNCPNVGK